jgi:hypothetical protein
MSQSEPLLLMALGAALALIFVIIFSRGLWEIAVRVMRQRRENEVAPDIIALEAQRDKLRAEHAMMKSRMETTIADTKAKMAEQSAEVSRTRNAMMGLQQDVADRDRQLEDRARDMTMLAEKLVEAEALANSRAKALKELDELLGQKNQDESNLRGEIAKLQMELASTRDGSMLPPVSASSELPVPAPLPITASTAATQSPFQVPTVRPEGNPLTSSQAAQSSLQDIIEQARKAMLERDNQGEIASSPRTKVLRSARSGGLGAITERLKAMHRTNGA